MSVPNENTEIQFTLTSTGQTLATNFTFLEEDDLQVFSGTTSTNPVALVKNSDYTVTLPLQLGQNGSITMTPGTIGEVITITRCPPCTQLTVFVENDRFPAKVQERTHDKAYMLACKAIDSIFGPNARAIRYPLTEFGTNNVVPIKDDRTAGGAGTVFGWKGTDGAPDVLSKGSLNLVLTLSNDSAMGGASPDPVNGSTQRAIKIYIDANDTLLQTEIDAIEAAVGLNTDGTYISHVGTNYIDGATTFMAVDALLDAQIKVNEDAISDNGDRLDDLEAILDEINVPDKTTIVSGTTAVSTFQTLAVGTAPTGKTAIQINAFVSMEDTGGGGGEVKITLKDRKGNEFEIVCACTTTGNRTVSDTNAGIFTLLGGGTFQYKVEFAGTTNNESWRIERWSYL